VALAVIAVEVQWTMPVAAVQLCSSSKGQQEVFLQEACYPQLLYSHLLASSKDFRPCVFYN
jgi:hypothetical protein